MRLTTKIVLSITLAVFIFPLIFVILPLYFNDGNAENAKTNKVNFSQDNKTGIELSMIKTIIIEEVPVDVQERKYSLTGDCYIYFEPAKENDMLYIPEAIKEFVSVRSEGDTLMVRLNVHDMYIKNNDEKYLHHDFSGVNLYFNTLRIDVINTIEGLNLNVKNIETDSVKVSSHGNINIDYCKVLLLDPQVRSRHKSLNITNCEVERLNLDFDNLHHWNINNSNIGEEYISASRRIDITQDLDEVSTINWNPQGNDAELNIKIQGENKKISIQEN